MTLSGLLKELSRSIANEEDIREGKSRKRDSPLLAIAREIHELPKRRAAKRSTVFRGALSAW
jgi:hypothetical protein